jgi:hypothetical protein
VVLPYRRVTGITVLVGTFHGAARGNLVAEFCTGMSCGSAVADLAGAADNAPVTFIFAKPLEVPPSRFPFGTPFHYQIRLADGLPAAIWLAPAQDGSQRPVFSFIGPATGAPALPLAFQDDSTSIYELPNPAPYAELSNPACRLAILRRQKMVASCPAAATLLRREMFDPGWSAQVNGRAVPVLQDGLFQRVAIPAGVSVVRFSYAPPHIGFACALALLGLVFWLGQSSGSFLKKRTKKLL